MVILTNILAYLFILTAIGFFVAMGCMIAAGLQFYSEAKRVMAMVDRPKSAGIRIVRTAQGAVMRDAAHISAIGKTAQGAFQTIKDAKDDILGTADSIDMEDVKEAATSARETIASTLSIATMGMQLAKQIFGIMSQAREQNGSA